MGNKSEEWSGGRLALLLKHLQWPSGNIWVFVYKYCVVCNYLTTICVLCALMFHDDHVLIGISSPIPLPPLLKRSNYPPARRMFFNNMQTPHETAFYMHEICHRFPLRCALCNRDDFDLSCMKYWVALWTFSVLISYLIRFRQLSPFYCSPDFAIVANFVDLQLIDFIRKINDSDSVEYSGSLSIPYLANAII